MSVPQIKHICFRSTATVSSLSTIVSLSEAFASTIKLETGEQPGEAPGRSLQEALGVDVFGGSAGLLNSSSSPEFDSISIMPGLLAEGRYLSLKTISGKIRKIQSKEFTDQFSKGEYYPPEGCTKFSLENSSTFYIYGGARASKPGHWGLSNNLFQIQTSPILTQNNTAHEITSFKMFNQSVSKTSQFTKLFGASSITEVCESDMILGFTINGKDLDCPSERQFVSNEIRIFEIANETTFRNVIIRSGKGDIEISDLKKNEKIQLGDIPIPSYGSALIRTPNLDSEGLKAAVKVGGAVLKNRELSDVELLFSGAKMWEEVSTNEVHILSYDVKQRTFSWKSVKIDGLEPRAFHSAVQIDRFVYIFGGLNLGTNQRYGISPLRINLMSWEISQVVVGGAGEGSLAGYLSGSALLPSADKVYLIGGYTDPISKEGDKPCDSIVEVSFSSQGRILSRQILFSLE